MNHLLEKAKQLNKQANFFKARGDLKTARELWDAASSVMIIYAANNKGVIPCTNIELPLKP